MFLLLDFHNANLAEMCGGFVVKFIAKFLALFRIGHAQQFKHRQIKRAAVGLLEFPRQSIGSSASFFARTAERHSMNSSSTIALCHAGTAAKRRFQFLRRHLSRLARVGHFQQIHIHHFGFQIAFRAGVTPKVEFEKRNERRIYNACKAEFSAFPQSTVTS